MKKFLNSMVWVVAMSAILSGCGSKEEAATTPTTDTTTAVASSSSKAVDPASVGRVRGKVLFEGSAPEPKMLSVKGNPECAALHQGGMIASEDLIVKDGFLKNVVVYVKEGLESYKFETPQTPVEVDNKNCVYVPHVSAAMVGQEVVFVNGDSTLHNVHSYPKNSKAFNLGLPMVGMKQTRRFDTPEVAVQLKCDVHPWMLGYLAVLPHPVFAVTGDDGSFELKNVPAGEYTVEAWHEKLGTQSMKVTVSAGQEAPAEFKFVAA